MYRSVFLREKIIEQNEKRKKDRKNKKLEGESGTTMQEHSLLGGKKKVRGGDDGLLGEEVQEIIDELKNDLRIRDMEFEELKASMAKLQAENAQLRQ